MAFKIPQINVPPDVLESRRAVETLERELIFGMVKFYKFYRSMRDVVCPFDPSSISYRQDFSIKRYNVLYEMLDTFYRRFDHYTEVRDDLGIPNATMAAYVIDRTNRGQIPKDIGAQLVDEINDETEYSAALDLDSLRALAGSAPFADWLKTSVTKLGLNTVDHQRQLGLLTMESLAEAVERMKLATTPTRTDNMVNGAAFAFFGTKRKIKPCVPLHAFPGLSEAIGGGFFWGDSTMVAGINAGGKSVLMMQFADAFVQQGYRTVLFTTERRPDELFMRCVSNRLGVDLRRLNDTSKNIQNEEIELDYIPDWIWSNPGMSAEMEVIQRQYGDNLLFMDWSKGENLSIPSNFDPTMEQIERTGWNPQVVLFDWIGGGLDIIKEKDKLRLYYAQAADHLINHGKRKNRSMIMAAQLDKNVVLPGKNYVDMSMLSECKTMTNNLTNFIGITTLRDSKAHEGEGAHTVMHRRQNLCVAKATRGKTGMIIPVNADFQYQRFTEIKKGLTQPT